MLTHCYALASILLFFSSLELFDISGRKPKWRLFEDVFLRLIVFYPDVTSVLCELELIIKRVKVSTTPDGKVMDLFFVTDTRFYSLSMSKNQCELRKVIVVYHFLILMFLQVACFCYQATCHHNLITSPVTNIYLFPMFELRLIWFPCS